VLLWIKKRKRWGALNLMSLIAHLVAGFAVQAGIRLNYANIHPIM